MIIGLIGYKNSGKDTVADYLVQQHQFKKMAFADPVKEICKIMFDLSHSQLHDPIEKETLDERWGITPRRMMQRVGTDMIRDMWGNDFWVQNMNVRCQHFKNIVVSDVRFHNEADWVREKNGVLIRIVDGTQHTDNHPSETEQLSIRHDMILVNPKQGLESFYSDIENVIVKTIVRHNNNKSRETIVV